jgi:hypothetical protein
MSSQTDTSVADDCKISTWAIAENADNVLHSRIQSYLIAQTFLVTAYATLLTVTYSTEIVFLARYRYFGDGLGVRHFPRDAKEDAVDIGEVRFSDGTQAD